MSNGTPSNETVVFPTHVSPIGIFFVVVPALVMVFAALTIVNFKLPAILLLLLLAVVCCCAVLAKEAIEEMGEVAVEWSAQGITIRRLLGSVSYYWSHIERVEMYDPGATFGDSGRHEDRRTAIGLVIRDPQRKDKNATVVVGDTPGVMVVSRVGDAAEKIPKLAERLANAKRYGGGKDGRKIGGGPATNSRGAKQFRRAANTASA